MRRLWGLVIALLLAWGIPVPAQAAGTADLSLSVAAPGTADQSTFVTFTAAYTNAGPDTATNLTVEVVFPAGLNVNLILSSGFCTVAVGGQDVSCDVGTVASGSSGSVPIVVTAFALGTYTIPFTVRSDQADPTPRDDAVTATLAVVPATHADLTVAVGGPNDTARVTQTPLFQAAYGNNGPIDATGVLVGFQLPAGVSFVAAGSDPRCAPSGQTIRCAVGTVAAMTAATVAIAMAAGTPGTYAITATIQGDQPDPNPANNASTANFTFLPAEADLNLAFIGTTVRPVAGSPVELAIRAVNFGPDPATGVAVQVAFPGGWTADPAHSDPECSATSTTELRCVIGGLAASTETVLVVAGVPSTAGTFAVTATINGDQVGGGERVSTTVTVLVPSADLSAVASGPSGSVNNRQVFTDTVVVRNSGPDTAKSVALTSLTAASGDKEVEIQSITTTAGSCSEARGTVTCALGDLAAGATATVMTSMTVSGPANATDTSTVTSSTPDPDPGNNTAAVTTIVK